jgi:hypothetical protein
VLHIYYLMTLSDLDFAYRFLNSWPWFAKAS